MHTRYCTRCPKEVTIMPPPSSPMGGDQGDYLKAIAEACCPQCGGKVCSGPKLLELAVQWKRERDSAAKHAEEHRRMRDMVVHSVAEAIGVKWEDEKSWAPVHGALVKELRELREWRRKVSGALGWMTGDRVWKSDHASGVAREAVRGLESLREHVAVVASSGAPGKALQSALASANKRVVSLEEMFARSLHVENTGEGWKILLGNGETVLEWLGDGISAEQVLHRKPALTYMVDTTPHVRCLRMLVEWWNWPVACALVTGSAGVGELRPSHELREDNATGQLAALREAAHDVMSRCTDNDIELDEAVELLEATIEDWKEEKGVAK